MMNKKVVVLMAQKMSYDHSLDFSLLSDNVAVYDDADETKMASRLEGCEILITKENPVPASMIESFPESLKLIVEAGTGYNNIDIVAARKKGITVCNVPAYSTERVVETQLMLMLMLASTMHEQVRMLYRGDKSNFENYLSVPHYELLGKTLGIVGAGRIGKRVAEVASVLGMKVLVYTRTPQPDTENYRHVSLETLLTESDYVSLHCPLTEQTHHLLNKERLSLMKKSAFLINTARGPLIDEKALIEVLKEKQIAGAALDVQEVEPMASDNELYLLDNVILTPHMGWKGLETRQRMLKIMVDDVKAYVEGNPINVVN